MIFLIVIFFLFILIRFPIVTCALTNPIKVVVNGSRDVFFYFKHKEYNKAKYGFIKCFVASVGYAFGAGKTLFAIFELCSIYRKYNGKPVWCNRRKKFVKQRIYIMSNVEFRTIPYVHMDSLRQFVDLSDSIDEYDDIHDTYTVTYALCDEASSQMNSRSYKDNFDPLFIRTLLTSRHFRASFYLTSQKFGMVDKLMRECVTYVVSCAKLWRFQRYTYYEPMELENATNELMIRPIKRGCWFVSNKDYQAYDTFACVASLKKSCENGDMRSESEILSMLGSTDSDVEAVTKFSKAYKRNHRRLF